MAEKAAKTNKSTKLFVLDTNVLMHDPMSLFRFEKHDIFLPMVVLEELDKAKKGLSEVSRNVRSVSRNLDELVKGISNIREGCPLPQYGSGDEAVIPGNLYFQTEAFDAQLPAGLAGSLADNTILSVTLWLSQQHSKRTVTLVSKDINLRIKATAMGLNAEDYYSDAQELDDMDLLYAGMTGLGNEKFVTFCDAADKAPQDRSAMRKILAENARPKQFVYHEPDEGGPRSRKEFMVDLDESGELDVQKTVNYAREAHAVWGMNARNPAQNFALNLLMDPSVDIVTLCGAAGTGKTLLALAAGLSQVLEPSATSGSYNEIIMTRVTVPIGEDIGFLPGTEEEKMTPWMGALMDNLEVLGTAENEGGQQGGWARSASNDFLMNKIKIRSLNFMRGRTFLNRFIIVDEAQNLTPKQMKALITRVGPGSKIICMGNLAQIDTPYLSETTSGLTYVVERFKNWAHSGHITLTRGERSRLADFASQEL